MKIFISHSTVDKPLVDELNRLIKATFKDRVEIAYSSASVAQGGIEAGQDWLEWVRTQIRTSQLAVIVLTPHSKARPWVMWEAGAVAGIGLERASSSPVVPLLFGLTGSDVPSPLQSRQIKLGTTEGDVQDLLESIQRLGKLTFQPATGTENAISSYLDAVRKLRVPGMQDVFISCPMASVKDADYDILLASVRALSASLSARGYKVYSAIERIGAHEELEPEAIAAERDLAALSTSRNYVLIYPRVAVSSCLLEAGYALVAGIPSTYFVRKDEDLPYLLRGAVESFRNAKRVKIREHGEIVDYFQRFPDRLVD